ncbi:MAG: hypothetical protein WCW61_01705 [Patescibacteria group bacterium]|jgi:hypothetical protein
MRYLLKNKNLALLIIAAFLFGGFFVFAGNVKAIVALPTTWNVDGSLVSPACTVTEPNCATIQEALNSASSGDTIFINGIIGDVSNYTAYEITEPLTIEGASGAEVYGSFIIKTDGVTINGLKIYTRGGGNGPLKTGIDVIAKNATITNNVFELPNPEALAASGGVGNGLTIWPNGDGSINYSVSGNTFNGFSSDTNDWSSSALQIAEGISLSRFSMTGSSAVVDLDPAVEKSLALGNTYVSCSNNYVHSNWSSGTVYKYLLASTADQLSSIEYVGDGGIVLLGGDITTTSQINVDAALTIDGNSYTLSPNFTKTDNTNNSALGIHHDGVTVKNITINGHEGTNLHGINTYLANDVILDTVTISNNTNGAAMIVNGSSVTASNFNTSGNAWGAVNVDPGSGVTVPSGFTLTGANNLSENTQVWSDGAHVSETATVAVSVGDEYVKYTVAGYNNYYIWANKAMTDSIIMNNTIYSSIQAAIDASSAITADTIDIGAGEYTENLTISHPVNLIGPNAGINPNTGTPVAAAVITGKILISSGEVAVKGLTITNPTYGGATIKGVHIYSAGPVVSNVNLENNIFSNITNSQTKGSYGVMIQGDVSGISVLNNKIDKITSAGWSHAIEITPTCNSTNVPQAVIITGNKISNVTNDSGTDQYGFSIDWCDSPEIYADASQITFNHNSLIGVSIRNLDQDHILDSSKNYWGADSGPASGLVSDYVTASPWYVNETMTLLSDGDNNSITTSSDNTQTTSDGGVTVTSDIQSGTTITGNLSWDGTVSNPTATTKTVTISGYNTTVTSAIAIGSSVSDLTFDKAVKLSFSNQAGKHIGWYNQANVFTEITDICDLDTNTTTINGGNVFVDGGSCKMDVGSDLVVYTKHFSTFVTYTQSVISSGGGGSAPSTCSSVVYGDWGACTNGFQIRTILSRSSASCSLNTEQQIALSRACTNGASTENNGTGENVNPKENNGGQQQVLGVQKYAIGTLLRSKTNGKIYVVTGETTIKHIVNLKELFKYRGAITIVVTDGVIAAYSQVLGVQKYVDGTLVRHHGNPKIYVVKNGELVHIKTLKELLKYIGQPILEIN